MRKLLNETHVSIVNSRVTSARVHAYACSFTSVEQASGVWDVASGRCCMFDANFCAVDTCAYYTKYVCQKYDSMCTKISAQAKSTIAVCKLCTCAF